MVTKARGHGMSVEMSSVEWRHGDVALAYPLRDLEAKEAAMCVHLLRLST